MSFKINYKLAILIVVLLAVVGYVSYSSVASADTSKEYTDSLRSDLKKVRTDFKLLQASASASSFDSPDAPLAQYMADFNNADLQIQNVRATINAFDSKFKSHPFAPFTGFLPMYTVADETSKDVRYMSSQTKAVLSSYSDLIATLRIMNVLEGTLEGSLSEVNAITDFNLYTYQGDTYTQKAIKLREQNAALKAKKIPVEYKAYKDALLERSSSLADAFDDLAAGLNSNIDANVYTATAKIEDLSVTFSDKDKLLRFDANQKSLTLKQVSEITEKLDAFDPEEKAN